MGIMVRTVVDHYPLLFVFSPLAGMAPAGGDREFGSSQPRGSEAGGCLWASREVAMNSRELLGAHLASVPSRGNRSQTGTL
jgi:hypothetical protein